MKALITGASSGIGREFAYQLSELGYDIIAVARREDRLIELGKEIKTDFSYFVCDLSKVEECVALFEKAKDEDIDIIINNAGFGLIGEFAETELSRELEMIDVNCKALHTLMKLFLQKFYSENKGYILNVCSIAAFLPGPLMATYYATKAYVLSLSRAIYEEIRKDKKNIYVGTLCPGPVTTEFSRVSKASFAVKSRKADEVVAYAIKKMLKKKNTILPGIEVKLSAFASKFLPWKLLSRISCKIQKKKI